jgi:hypothetical protein
LTAALAIAAHGTAGGGLPSGSTATLLALVSITLGTLVATIRDAAGIRVLVTVLTVGQLLGHVLLGFGGHSHQSVDGAPLGVMIVAHVAAIAIGASLIAAGGHLCDAVSRVLVAVTRPAPRPVASMTATAVRSSDQPRQSARLLSTSLSHRGPPVRFAH